MRVPLAPFVLPLWLAAAACATSSPAPLAGIAPGWKYDSALVATGGSAMVVSGHPLASAVGRDILRQGGNAADAAVAVGFALAVVHPEAGNLGGGGFLVARTHDGQVRTLDYRETAPAAATRDMFVAATDDSADRSITGHLSAGVPGSVAGLVEAQARLGRLSLAQVIAPAIRLARDGFTVDEYRSQSIAGDSERLGGFPASRAAFLPGGRPPEVGRVLRQPELATTLEAVRDRGAGGFYAGPVADLIVAEMQRGRGLITHDDLRRYRPIWRDPVRVNYAGYTIISMPPASSGGVTMGEILNIMEGFRPLPPFGSPRLLHLEAEAMRRAFTDRNTRLGDPASGVGDARVPADHAIRQLDHPLFGGGRRGERGQLYHDAQQQLRQRGDGHRGRLPAERRDGRLYDRSGQAQPLRARSGRGERDRPRETDALGHDPDAGARPGGTALPRSGHARRSAHHHHGISRHQ